jgi:hypothetical protein
MQRLLLALIGLLSALAARPQLGKADLPRYDFMSTRPKSSSYSSPEEHAAKAAACVMRRILAMDEKLHELRRRLDQKTTEIESAVAAERGIGSIENMDPSDYERLQQDVEELLEQWEETAQQEGPGGMDDTPLNRLIAERFEIEQIILASRGQQGNDFAGDETQDA